MAVNCIETDVQDRCNGEDFDSDFNFVTNHPTIVECAKYCYTNYPTIVNALKESGVTYANTKSDYAEMDNKFSGTQMGIGWSSNLAQLAMTYYWTELAKDNPDDNKLKELYDNFVILSVLAQVIIDSCKREYEIDGEEEIKRISKMPCMTLTKTLTNATKNGKPKIIKCDFPEFMKYTREIPLTKNGKELPSDEIDKSRSKLKMRINRELQCPMNWLEEWLDKIQNSTTVATIPTEEFFIKMNGKPNNRQMSKIRSLIEKYDLYVKSVHASEFDEDIIAEKISAESSVLLDELQKIKIGNIITINRLIETSLGLESGVGASRKLIGINTRYTRKMLNYLYKMDKEKFLINFKSIEN